MCGFIGSVSKNEILYENLEKCNEQLICRGPDKKKSLEASEDNFNFKGVFNRLSIIDLSSNADQPMMSYDKNYILMFNGEIYNHTELRSQLIKKGYKFESSHSDTESLLYSFVEYGEETPEMLRGQFSFIFLDKRKNTIYLCRDRLGQKPLYYFLDKETLNFSSNLISLANYCGFNQVNESSIFNYLNYGISTGKDTIFKKVMRVMPGELIKIDLSKNIFESNSNIYWDLENYYDIKKFKEEEFINLLEESVLLRTNSDVPYATFLSGGLDSTSIIKSQKNMNLDINSFSVYMNESKFDERKYSEEVSKVYNTNHDYIQFNDQITLEMVDGVLETLDEPFADPSYIPTFLLSNMISKKYKVALSGDGGDELLGGYLRVQKAMKNTNNINSIFNNLIFKLYPARFGTGNTFLSKNIDLNTRYNSFLSDSKLLNLLDVKNTNIPLNQFSENKYENYYKQLMENEYRFFLSQMMMFKVDRASMANSLEIRSPFVDNKLIEYVFSHSNEYFDINNPKLPLKNYLKSDFGSEFLNRKKQGFIFDVESFVYKYEEEFYESTIYLSKVIDVDIESIKKLFKFKTRMNANRIWKLKVLSHYFNKNL
tara:strand:- start:1225 stop:3018 length:1794 start_codon:yes stop_codon:yes gene_type:complete